MVLAMMKNFFKNSSSILTRRQTSILSAATVIMVMIAASRILGLIRNRVLAHFFSAETLAVYFAAFRLPEVIFEVLIFGALSSAFIPIFTSYISRKQKDQAWYVAAISLNFAFLIFSFLAILIFIFANPLYRLIAPGFAPEQTNQIASLTRILILAQGFFVLSYFLTGVLESLQRFLIPAIAPLFYNLGIIFGTIFLAPSMGIYAPTIGAVIGAALHFLIQLPLAIHLGFRPRGKLDFSHPGVRGIGRLALPRIVELSFLQVGKSAELFLASFVSIAAYTYYTFANSLQLLPVGLFGTSIAKASLPSLSYQSARGETKQFSQTFTALFGQILFLTLPCAVFLAVLRIPVVRLVFGAARFTWESTVQTSLTLSAFSLGIFSQALIYLLNRAFYALHDTTTPVKISIVSIILNIILGVVFILGIHLPIWSLALAYSLASIFQFLTLCVFLIPRLPNFDRKKLLISSFKIFIASFVSGGLMFVFLKILDRSVWDKHLSFLGWFGLALPISFDRFVLDTRYTLNLIYLTAIVGFVGLASYLLLSRILRIEEMSILTKILAKIRKAKLVPPRIPKEKEPITITST